MTTKTMTILEVCQELNCNFRIVHEIPTEQFGVRLTSFQTPPNNLMWEHEKEHLLTKEKQ